MEAKSDWSSMENSKSWGGGLGDVDVEEGRLTVTLRLNVRWRTEV